MSQEQGFKVATGPDGWVMVQTAEDAVKLGKAFVTMVADLGVYKAERDRLAAENERLCKVGFRLAERLSWCGNLGDEPLIEEWQQLTGTDVYKDEEGRDAK